MTVRDEIAVSVAEIDNADVLDLAVTTVSIGSAHIADYGAPITLGYDEGCTSCCSTGCCTDVGCC